jgi:hypothetical protein
MARKRKGPSKASRRKGGRKKRKGSSSKKNVQRSIARRKGISMERAGKILGAATKRNPILRKRAVAGRKRARRRK